MKGNRDTRLRRHGAAVEKRPANGKEATMQYMVTRRQTTLAIPTNSSAYFAAAGFFALAGLLLWAAEQD